jgi:adenylate cyclase
MAQVIIEQPGVPPMTVTLDTPEVNFGRSDDSDVVLVADEVSRHHAKIVQRAGKVILQDLKSMNGTYVNRQRIVERVLADEDEIWFGSKCRLRFRDDRSAMPTEQVMPAVMPQPAHASSADEAVLRNVDKIRAEMELLGNTMTLMGRGGTPAIGGVHQTITTESAPDDLIRIGRAYRRLAALFEVSKIMAGDFDLDHRLSTVMDRILEVMDADRGFVVLRDPSTGYLNLRLARQMGQDLQSSSPSMGIAGRAAIDGQPVLMTDSSTDQEFGMRDSIIQQKIRSAMCVPLQMSDQILGSIYIDTQKFHVAFTEEDLELFASMAAQAAMAIHNVQLHDQVVDAEKRRQDFGRFLSPDIVDKIMSEGATFELGGQKTEATTFFCDIRGFTNISENSNPQAIVELLNQHFTHMTEIIFDYRGTINKFIGDEVMAVFGVPFPTGDEPFQAVCAAIAIQNKNRELNLQREKDGQPAINIGIGIETGEVCAGYVGSPMRMEYTVIGDKVNTASRLCGLAKPGQIIVGVNTWQRIEDRVEGRPTGSVMLKGKEKPVQAFEITGLRD